MTLPAVESKPASPGAPVDGSVVWFKAQKGYGFVKPDDGGADVFVHVAELARIEADVNSPKASASASAATPMATGRFFAVGIELIG